MFGIGQSIRRKPRQYSYNPRYYDADAEARNQRRIELGHAPREEDGQKKEYTPGDILRARSEQRARQAERNAVARRKSNKVRMMFALLLIVGLVLLVRSIMQTL